MSGSKNKGKRTSRLTFAVRRDPLSRDVHRLQEVNAARAAQGLAALSYGRARYMGLLALSEEDRALEAKEAAARRRAIAKERALQLWQDRKRWENNAEPSC